MSFGFSISDFCTVGDLAWALYHDCYKVARGAPQEFQLLLAEISTLSNAFKILQEEAKDPDSALVQAGENRVQMVNEMVKGIGDTLKKLEKVAKKYQILGSSSKRQQLWTKFKWSVEFSDIDSLRSKLVYHNSVMSLLLTSVGNSSLERVVSSNAILQSDVKDIKGYISGYTVSRMAQIPSLSGVDDEVFKASLSAALMRNAEIFQPWSTIGVDVWIEAGRWWLLRSQMELHTVTAPNEKITLAAYANLIKSSWILVDIISCHPQFQFITASTRSEVQALSAELKVEFARLSAMELVTPNLGELEGQDLRIWEVSTRTPLLRPHKDTRGTDAWKVASGEEVLFQRFAICELTLLANPTPCIVLFLVQGDARAARLVAQHQDGSVIMTATFEQPLSHTELGNSVTTSDFKLVFNTNQDAQTLSCLTEATNWYLNERTATHADLDDLKAYVLLTAVKNLRKDVVARLLLLKNVEGDDLGDSPKRGVTSVALSFASLCLKPSSEKQKKGKTDDDNDDYREKGLSLWAWAIQCGHLSLVELLAEQVSITHEVDAGSGGWYNKMTPFGNAFGDAGSDGWYKKMTPLGLASLYGHEAIFRTLIAKGADPHKEDESGKVALYHASSGGNEEIVRMLLGHESGVNIKKWLLSSSLLIAASKGHENVIRILIDHGADIESRDSLGTTPLMQAASNCHEAAVILLLEKGANPLATDKHGVDTRWKVYGGMDTMWKVVYGMEDFHVSNELVNVVYKRACEIMHPSLPCPPLTRTRRAQMRFCMGVRWAYVWLYSHHAYLEIPPHYALNGPGRYHRTFNLVRSFSVDPSITFNFSIVHQEDTLEFAIAFSDKEAGAVTLQVVGGGIRSFPRTIFWNNFQTWTFVELDPNAEYVDVDAVTLDDSPTTTLARLGI